MSFSDPAILGVPATAPTTSSPAAFKDWSLVCDALGQGRQSIILRKGGIAEGRQGFRFKHDEFYLFPTQYHQQAERVRPEELSSLHPSSPPPEGEVSIRYFYRLEWAEWIADWSAIERLQPFHVWRVDVLKERFSYDEQLGLQCAFGRVYRLNPAWTFPDRPSFGGCRSWITLPDPSAESFSLTPVLTDERHAEVTHALRQALDLGPSIR